MIEMTHYPERRASVGQVRYLRRLLEARGYPPTLGEAYERFGFPRGSRGRPVEQWLREMPRQDASTLIDVLLEEPPA